MVTSSWDCYLWLESCKPMHYLVSYGDDNYVMQKFVVCADFICIVWDRNGLWSFTHVCKPHHGGKVSPIVERVCNV